jgi:hypothetical protein
VYTPRRPNRAAVRSFNNCPDITGTLIVTDDGQGLYQVIVEDHRACRRTVVVHSGLGRWVARLANVAKIRETARRNRCAAYTGWPPASGGSHLRHSRMDRGFGRC